MLKAIVTALAVLAGTSGAMASCYDGLGCDDSDYFTRGDVRQLSCQALWEVRNTIYQQNGYCFSTDRARAFFSNQGCWITDQGSVRLNAYERGNVATIQSVEKAKGCR